ncbi:MAG: hypothetical protein ACP5MW_06605 [Thermoplasmata archaeon]
MDKDEICMRLATFIGDIELKNLIIYNHIKELRGILDENTYNSIEAQSKDVISSMNYLQNILIDVVHKIGCDTSKRKPSFLRYDEIEIIEPPGFD